MKYADAKANIEALNWTADAVPSTSGQLELLAALQKSGGDLPDRWEAVWYAHCEELRRAADYWEGELVRRVRMNLPKKERPTWVQTAERLEAPIGSKQGMAQRWLRLTRTQTRRAPHPPK